MDLPWIVANDGGVSTREASYIGGSALQTILAIDSQLDSIGTSFSVVAHETEALMYNLDTFKEQVLAREQALSEETGDDSDFYGQVLLQLLSEVSCVWQFFRCFDQDIQRFIDEHVAFETAVNQTFVAAASFKAFRVQRVALVDDAVAQIRALSFQFQEQADNAKRVGNNANRELRVLAAETIATDPWTRTTIAAHGKRARKAFSRARKLGFVARRAVEFKFVVDLDRTTNPMLLGDVPSAWSRDIFLDGYLFDVPVEQFTKPTVDYLEHLSDFVVFGESTVLFMG